MERHKSVESFITNNPEWQHELILLREIVLATHLEETVKWGFPVYTYGRKNVVGLGAFKSYTGLWFFQGGLLADKNKRLMNAQEGKTKAMRQWRFKNVEEIKKNLTLIEAYIKESVGNHKQGRSITPGRNKPVVIPEELEEQFNVDKVLKEQFDGLSLSKRSDYAEHVAGAKREETRKKRMEKIVPMIKEGVGLHDKYK